MHDTLVCRLMTVRDIDQIAALERVCFAAPWSREALMSELQSNRHACYLVLAYNDTIYAYGGMWCMLDEAHVTNVAVRPEQRGKGLGKYMMQRLMHTAVKLGARQMTLEVRVSNTVALQLYRGLDFVIRGVRPHYYPDNKEDAYIMWNQNIKATLACMNQLGAGENPQ